MKDFFKRIGRGIKKVGRKIGDFFDSKVGKIIGGIMLAVALPQIFSSFFSSSTVTGAGATKQATLIGKGGKSALVAKGSAVEGTLATAETIKDVQGAVNLGSRFKAAAKQMGSIFTSPREATKRTLDFMTGGGIGTGGVGSGDLAVAESWRGTSFAKPEIGASYDQVVKVGKETGGNFSQSLDEWATAQGPEKNAIWNADLAEMGITQRPVAKPYIPSMYSTTESIAPESFGTEWVNRTGDVVSQDKINLYKMDQGLTTRAKEKFLQDKKFRNWYDKTTGLYGDSETYDITTAQLELKPSSAYRGVSEFPTFSDAAAGGPLGQAKHVMTKSWGEILPYKGEFSEMSVARTGQLGYTTGQTMFGKQEEYNPPSYNPAAIDQVSRNLDIGNQLISSRQADNFYEPLRNATPTSASSIIKKIHQDAGMGYAYGAYAPFNNYADA